MATGVSATTPTEAFVPPHRRVFTFVNTAKTDAPSSTTRVAEWAEVDNVRATCEMHDGVQERVIADSWQKKVEQESDDGNRKENGKTSTSTEDDASTRESGDVEGTEHEQWFQHYSIV
uniref:Tyrosine-protein phosphatase non-receptor type 4 n=1 Tax=Lygus hesperus TaxID=30085 RepID=A0A0A9W567_LYGHE